MSNSNRDELERLHAEISRTQAMNDEQAAHMVELQGHIQRGIENPEHHFTLSEALEKSIALFEVDHPSLAAAIRSAVLSLSSGGI